MDLWKDLITLLAVVDPIGTIPIYLTATMGMTVAAQRKVAVRATLIAAGVLTAFIVAGQIVLNAMGISLSAYQVAGGIVLFLFALQMVFDPGSHTQEADQSKGQDVAIRVHGPFPGVPGTHAREVRRKVLRRQLTL